MAELKVTHIGNFFQEFSHPIPHLKGFMIWGRDLHKRAYQIIKIISVISDEEVARKRLDHAQSRVAPPYNPCLVLNIS